MLIVHFLEPLTANLCRPVAMKALCYCFGSEGPSRFSGTGMIIGDFTRQTDDVRKTNLRDDGMQSLRDSMAFQTSD